MSDEHNNSGQEEARAGGQYATYTALSGEQELRVSSSSDDDIDEEEEEREEVATFNVVANPTRVADYYSTFNDDEEVGDVFKSADRKKPDPFKVDERMDENGVVQAVDFWVLFEGKGRVPEPPERFYHKGWLPFRDVLLRDFTAARECLGRVEAIDPTALSELKSLSGGAFGDVFLGVMHGTEDVFVKSQELDDQFATEVATLLLAYNEHLPIPALLALCKTGAASLYPGRANEAIMLTVFERSSGMSAETYFAEKRSAGELDEAEQHRFALYSAFGLHATHTAQIVHNDVALRNYMTDGKACFQLIDYGLSVCLVRAKSAAPYFHSKVPIHQAAPEMKDRSEDGYMCSAATDVYQYGWMLRELYAGKHVVAADRLLSEEELAAEIAASVPASVAPIILGCLAVDVKLRWSLPRVISELGKLSDELHEPGRILSAEKTLPDALVAACRDPPCWDVIQVLEASGDAQLLRFKALKVAAEAGDVAVLKQLGSNGEVFKLFGGVTAAHDLVSFGHSDVLLQLCEQVDDEVVRGCVSSDDSNLLLVCATYEVWELVEPLLTRGVDPQARSRSGLTAFGLTLEKNVEALLPMLEHVELSALNLRSIAMAVGKRGDVGVLSVFEGKVEALRDDAALRREMVLAAAEAGHAELVGEVVVEWMSSAQDEVDVLCSALESGDDATVELVLHKTESRPLRVTQNREALVAAACEGGSRAWVDCMAEEVGFDLLEGTLEMHGGKKLHEVAAEQGWLSYTCDVLERGELAEDELAHVRRTAMSALAEKVGGMSRAEECAAFEALYPVPLDEAMDTEQGFERCVSHAQAVPLVCGKVVTLAQGQQGRATLYKQMRWWMQKKMDSCRMYEGMYLENVASYVLSLRDFTAPPAVANSPAYMALMQFVADLTYSDVDIVPSCGRVHDDTPDAVRFREIVELLQRAKVEVPGWEEYLFACWAGSAHGQRQLMVPHLVLECLDELYDVLFVRKLEEPEDDTQPLLPLAPARMRSRMTGIMQSEFDVTMPGELDQVKLCSLVAGGQRSERRKWINLFDQLDVILYVFSVASYGRVIFEDERTNHWTEGIDLLRKLLQEKAVERARFVLVLSQVDLLDSVLPVAPFQPDAFRFAGMPAFTGRRDSAEDVIAFCKTVLWHVVEEEGAIERVTLVTCNALDKREVLRVMTLAGSVQDRGEIAERQAKEVRVPLVIDRGRAAESSCCGVM